MATQSPPSLQIKWLFVVGVGLAGFGVILRFSARALAWPSNFGYSGPRENTDWAFTERAYIDISLFAIGFGLATVLLATWLLYRDAGAARPSP